MTTLLNILIAVVLVGDYLMLSVNRLVFGSNTNWLLLVGIAQGFAVILAVILGHARALRMNIPMLGFLGLGLVMLAHTANRAITIGDFDDYGTVKTLTFFAISAPAFLLGSILGQFRELPGSRWYPVVIIPLLLMCILALVTDPSVMTTRTPENLAVMLGVLVLPVHQGLAFSMGKITLWLHTTTQRPNQGRIRLLATLGLIGFCLGMAVLSGSRGYLIAAIFALVLQWAFGRKRLGFVLLAAGVPFALFLLLSNEAVRRGLDPTVIMNSTSMYERMDLFEAALEAFWASPIFGHGPGGFAVFYGWHERVYPHNIILEILSELGLVGIACFAMILLPVVVRAGRVCLRRDMTDVQFFAVGFLAFSIIGAMGVADMIRNHFLFLAAGMTAVSCAPSAVTIGQTQPVAKTSPAT